MWSVSEQRFLRVISLPAVTGARRIVQLGFVTPEVSDTRPHPAPYDESPALNAWAADDEAAAA